MDQPCGKRTSSCVCTLKKGVCDGRHLCMNDGCGGSWRGDVIMQNEDILMIPSRREWAEHLELTERVLAMDPIDAEIALILEQ